MLGARRPRALRVALRSTPGPKPSNTMLSTRFLRALGLACSALPSAFGQSLEVHVINVDQGLSVFVKSPAGTRVLIDGGNPGDGNAIVRPFLQSIGVAALDYSVMTHWHTDHFGGLTEVHNSSYKPLIAAYDRGDASRPSNGFVTSYLSAVGTKRAIPSVGQTLDLGGGCTLTFIARDGQYVGGSVNPSGEENAYSLGMVIRYGDFDLYVAGDLTAGGLGTPNVEGPTSASVGQVEVAISSHHGSPSSSSSTVVNNLNPSLVVHSAGHDNSYGHPAEVVVDAWSTPAATRVQWCTTDGETLQPTLGGDPGGFNAIQGHILITSDGTTFRASSPTHAESVDFATFEQAGTLAGVGQVVVNELLIDPLNSADAVGEWIELQNVGTQTLNLGGMQFVSGAQSFTLRSQVLLAGGERFLVGLDGRASRNGNVFLGVGAPWQQFGLANTASSLQLRTATNAVMETVSWGSGAIAVTPGVSAERILSTSAPTANNFAAALNAWSTGDLGTPWEQNDNALPTCPAPVPYGTGKLTSNLTLPRASWSGTPSLDTNDFQVVLVDGLPLKSTILFYGFAPDQKPFSGGTLWVDTPVRRMSVSQTDSLGSVAYPVAIDASMPGTKRYYQFWFRDPFHPDGTNVGLSAALEVQFCPLPGPPAPGQLVITEVMKDPSAVADSAGEWIEVYNTTNVAIDIEGWALRDRGTDNVVLQNGGLGIFVPAHGYLVLAANTSSATNGGVLASAGYDWNLFKLDNADDEVLLVAPGAVEVDAIDYDNGFIWPDTPGRSLSLKAGTLDALLNDDGNNWCHGNTPIHGASPDSGTPGAANDACP